MAAWAYECQSAAPEDERWLVACLVVDSMPGMPAIVRIRVGDQWRCARVDRTRRLEVQAMQLRDVIASNAEDCPECAEPPLAPGADDSRAPAAPARRGREVQAAAISMAQQQFVVVLVNLDLIDRPGEADMAIADMRPRFGGVEIVLMGQHEDGTPKYHGDPTLVGLLAQVPVDRMPWKAYPIG